MRAPSRRSSRGCAGAPAAGLPAAGTNATDGDLSPGSSVPVARPAAIRSAVSATRLAAENPVSAMTSPRRGCVGIRRNIDTLERPRRTTTRAAAPLPAGSRPSVYERRRSMNTNRNTASATAIAPPTCTTVRRMLRATTSRSSLDSPVDRCRFTAISSGTLSRWPDVTRLRRLRRAAAAFARSSSAHSATWRSRAGCASAQRSPSAEARVRRSPCARRLPSVAPRISRSTPVLDDSVSSEASPCCATSTSAWRAVRPPACAHRCWSTATGSVAAPPERSYLRIDVRRSSTIARAIS